MRVRFAPSPTGYLHVGSARTMLFNWLVARSSGGSLVLRIEDTDASRGRAEYLDAILGGFRWLGLDWDEGPEMGGNHGPYFQSERGPIYERYFERLRSAGSVYEDQGAWRFRTKQGPVQVDDLVCGKVTFEKSDEPDMTIRRPDGSWIFHFVNVIDDLEMEITHVIRGEDHLSNTPKHLRLFDALGEEPPRYGHIPLLLNPDGSKMSKRDAGASIAEYRERGFMPEAVVNYIATLGWAPPEGREILSLEELRDEFDLSKVNRKNAAYSYEKCLWMNFQHMAALSPEAYHRRALPYLEAAGVPLETQSESYTLELLGMVREKVKTFSELSDWIGYFYTEDYPFDPAAVAQVFAGPEAVDRLGILRKAYAGVAEEAWTAGTLETVLKSTAETGGLKVKDLVHPARVAVSGRTIGPSLYHMLELMGKERVLARFDRAAQRV